MIQGTYKAYQNPPCCHLISSASTCVLIQMTIGIFRFSRVKCIEMGTNLELVQRISFCDLYKQNSQGLSQPQSSGWARLPHFSSNHYQFFLFFLKLCSFSSSFWPSRWASRPPWKALATPLKMTVVIVSDDKKNYFTTYPVYHFQV